MAGLTVCTQRHIWQMRRHRRTAAQAERCGDGHLAATVVVVVSNFAVVMTTSGFFHLYIWTANANVEPQCYYLPHERCQYFRNIQDWLIDNFFSNPFTTIQKKLAFNVSFCYVCLHQMSSVVGKKRVCA